MSIWWVAVAVGAYAAAELSLRLWKKDERLWELDSELGHRLKPNKRGLWKSAEFSNPVAINADGFVDSDFSAKTGIRKVFVLGSSFIEALQVPREKSVTYLLEQKLKNASVFNLAVSAYGPAHHLLLLKKYGFKYRPDVVVFTYLVGNDTKNVNPEIEEDKNRPFPIIKEGKLAILPSGYYNTLFSKVSRFAGKSFVMKEIVKSFKKSTRAAPLRWRVYEKNNRMLEKGFELGEAVISEAKKTAERLGSRFMVVVIPLFIEVDKNQWERMKEKYPELKAAQMDFEYPAKHLESFCRSEGIDCVLLKRTFAGYMKKNGALPMFEEDTHWNAAGHELVAESISKKVAEYFK